MEEAGVAYEHISINSLKEMRSPAFLDINPLVDGDKLVTPNQDVDYSYYLEYQAVI